MFFSPKSVFEKVIYGGILKQLNVKRSLEFFDTIKVCYEKKKQFRCTCQYSTSLIDSFPLIVNYFILVSKQEILGITFKKKIRRCLLQMASQFGITSFLHFSYRLSPYSLLLSNTFLISMLLVARVISQMVQLLQTTNNTNVSVL